MDTTDLKQVAAQLVPGKNNVTMVLLESPTNRGFESPHMRLTSLALTLPCCLTQRFCESPTSAASSTSSALVHLYVFCSSFRLACKADILRAFVRRMRSSS